MNCDTENFGYSDIVNSDIVNSDNEIDSFLAPNALILKLIRYCDSPLK